MSSIFSPSINCPTVQKASIHQLTTMLSTVLFTGHNHLLTTGADDASLWLSPELQSQWLAGGYDLEIGLF